LNVVGGAVVALMMIVVVVNHAMGDAEITVITVPTAMGQ
jgi:hypothetical protein